MDATAQDVDGLQPQAYHLEVVAHLKSAEPEVWAWASSMSVREQHVRDTRSMLLRETYRLTTESHPKAYAAAHVVLQRLEIAAPIVLYQAGDGAMNATLFFLPGEVHVVLHGPVLERLSEAELIAVLGHEIAHFKLWSSHDGQFHTAERILNHTLADPSATGSHAEASRRYGLHTELYADRGAAVAAQSALPAISALVKVQTGLVNVDPASFLQQAEELEASDASVSQGVSHPESYLRAQAVDKWWRGDPDFPQWLRRRLHGPLSMDRLDLSDQIALTAMTRRFISLFMQPEFMRGERAITQARAYFPDWGIDEPCATLAEFAPAHVDDSVREYLNFVMLDLALADPEVREAALLEAAKMARDFGALDALLAALKRDAGLGKRQIDKIVRSLPKQMLA
jgi:hypothetical protein